MKVKKLIGILAVNLLLSVSAMAQTTTISGVTYKVADATTCTVESIDKTLTSLIFHKTVNIGGTNYTTTQIKSGKLNGSAATTVTFDGNWMETDVSDMQLYNLLHNTQFILTNNTVKREGGVGELNVFDGVLWADHSVNERHIIAYPCDKSGSSYTVPDDVINILASAFRNNPHLETITLGAGVQWIRNEAFAGSPNLKEIKVAAGNTCFESVDGVLFQTESRRNSGLYYDATAPFQRTLLAYPAGKEGTTYTVPSGTKVLGRSCFYGSRLTTISFATSELIEIREFAFNNCYDLVNLTIPATVQWINMKYADPPCAVPGSGVQDSGNAATAQGSFNHCRSLSNLQVESGSTYYKMENGILFSYDGTRLVRYPCTETFPGYIVPANVTWIDSYAFDCTKVKHVVLPSLLPQISRNMFEDATNLEFITIPAKVTNIRQDAFKGCAALTQVFMMPETPPTLHNADVFGTNNPTIYTKPDGTFNSVTKTICTGYKGTTNYPSSRIETEIPLSLNANGMATMCRDFAVQLPAGIKAYNIPNDGGSTEVSSDYQLTLTQTNIGSGRFVSTRTGSNLGTYHGVVLKADNPNATYTYQISVEDYANTFGYRNMDSSNGPRSIKSSRYIVGAPVEKNITVSTSIVVNNANVDCTTFGLKGDKFQRTAGDGMIKCNKAYLTLPNANVPGKVPGIETSSSAKYTMVFKDFDGIDLEDSETTGIQEVNADNHKVANAGIVYDIQGHRVGDAAAMQQGALPKGIYILNGKKYIVK